MNEILTAISALLPLIIAGMSLFFAITNLRDIKREMRTYKPLLEKVDSTMELLDIQVDEEGELIIDNRLQKLIGGTVQGLAQSLKMSFLGQLSGTARLDKGLKEAMAKDIIEKKAPWLELVGDIFGINVTKYMTKHPEATGQLLQMAKPLIEQYMGNRNNGPRSGGGIQEMR